ncbi:MAG TPA: hypothetical protein VJ824_12595 [Bacillota bacterium]|nr:hypothetical protein [Bacillota bacterium]
MKRKYLGWVWIVFAMLMLPGCMYPKDRLAENQLSPTDQVQFVQKGIDEFFKEKEILPILTKDMDTPIYEKYVIDFKQMVPKFIPYVPGGAFEQGGSYLFVLTDVEKKPTVKLLDLKIVEKIADVQSRVTYYNQKKNALPVAGVVKPGYFTIQFNEIGLSKEQAVESPFSGESLPIIMDSKGVVGVDYTKDIELVLTNNQIQLSDHSDVREILPQNSTYVPVKSFPYQMENGKPALVFLP